ncbi:MAG: spermidine/putrescine ABC transporter substrate-binding protein [Gammaproteobacteria bacterium GWE2_37_16]|nr:MAG: spermidine/putrescine ABC transporter substrate-binding protein [Gammaproteobacteria bacterium GWE2_37_16]
MKIYFKSIIIFCLIYLGSFSAFAKSNVVNIYVWTAYLPTEVAKQFTKETGIRVNVSEYDSNETMYAKLKASSDIGYDIVFPSSYFLRRMRQQNMLHTLDKDKLPNFHYLNPALLNKDFDPKNDYSIPYLASITGIVVNSDSIAPNSVLKWQDLWRKDFKNSLLILDDMREVFSMALLTLGYSINDTDPKHIEEAYLKLKSLLPNTKIFNSDVEQNIYVDEDAVIGMGWNGDINLSQADNPKLKFIYPKEGFVISIDCLAITKKAPHLENAYKFINFLMRPDIAKKISLEIGYPSPNLGAIKLMSKELQENPLFNPNEEILKRGQIQNDVDEVLPLYERYWELLKIGS